MCQKIEHERQNLIVSCGIHTIVCMTMNKSITSQSNDILFREIDIF